MQYVRGKNLLVCRFDGDEDFFPTLKSVLEKENIKSAVLLNLMGMFKEVEIGWFDGKQYHKKFFPEEYEITSASGNVSLKDNGEPFVHLHVNLGDKHHNVFGGHMFSGKVFNVCEMVLYIPDDVNLYRRSVEGRLPILVPELKK